MQPLPPPETFNLLGPLHDLIARLLVSEGASGQLDNGLGPQLPMLAQPLEIQQLAGEVSGIRARIRRARAAVQDLPDIERSVEEQNEEIRALKARIEKQRRVLALG